MNPSWTEWAYEQGVLTGSGEKPLSLFGLQDQTPEVMCHLFFGTKELLSDPTKYSLWFRIATSPLQSAFILELRLQPRPGERSTEAEKDRYRTDRVSVWFLTHDERDDPSLYQRNPISFRNFKATNQVPASGPIQFSRQLHKVVYSTYDAFPLKGFKRWTDEKSNKRVCFGWNFNDMVQFNITVPDRISDAAKKAAHDFLDILKTAKNSKTMPQKMVVITEPIREHDSLVKMAWPRLCSLPHPTPPSYWPWIRSGGNPDEIMDFLSRNFELVPDYIQRAFALRNKDWWKHINGVPVEKAADVIPSNLKLGRLPAICQFLGPRQYLAQVLGGHAYENQADRDTLFRYYNGTHNCKMVPDKDGRKFLFLLNIRPPTALSDQEAASFELVQDLLPDPGEIVQVSIQLSESHGEEEWRGEVVAIPNHFRSYGLNVAVVARRPEVAGGVVIEAQDVQARFHFGHHGSPVGPLRARIVRLMTGDKPSTFEEWLKGLLFARDPAGLDNAPQNQSLPEGWKATVDRVCQERNLNTEQRNVVRYYFTHTLTLVSGPPGTGKSTLVDVIMQLEEIFRNQYWVCTGSNKAADVLTEKLCQRKASLSVKGFYRIRPMFRETLPEQHQQQPATVPSSSAHSPTDANAAISAKLAQFTEEIPALSLGALISDRMNLANAGKLQDPIYPTERGDLKDLFFAQKAVLKLRLEDDTEQTTALREQFTRALIKVQLQYVSKAQGIFTTDAAANGPMLKKIRVRSLIVDESSQMLEARLVSVLVHAGAHGTLSRILFIGDHKQLPPTIKATGNIFSEGSGISLFERLINAGFSFLQLLEQYRMEPTIALIVSTTMYGGNLRNGAITKTRPEVSKFRKWIKQFAGEPSLATSAVIISPTRASLPNISKTVKAAWGAQRMPGSTSLLNLQTASIIYKLVAKLTKEAGFRPTDILVTVCYRDQVSLLKAIFVSDERFEGIRVGTVDGSQGDERLIHIVDTVTFGWAQQMGMGFLGSERRRANVGLSRGKVGRIVVVPRDFTKGSGSLSVWHQLIEEARTKKPSWILGDAKLNNWEEDDMRKRFEDVVGTFLNKPKGLGHKNNPQAQSGKQQQPQSKELVKPINQSRYCIDAFVAATRTDESTARNYLGQCNWDLTQAIDGYYRKVGLEGDVEEIVRSVKAL